MSRDGLLLYEADGRWLLALGVTDARDVGNTDDSPTALAEAIAALLAEIRKQDARVVLALASDRCLAASWLSEEPISAGDRPALAYELENHLPYAAEELTADFYVQTRQVSAVAVVTADIAPLVEALESAGIQVASITSLALMWVSAFRATVPVPERPDIFISKLHDRWEWVRFQNDCRTEWFSSRDVLIIARRLEEESAANPALLRVTIVGNFPAGVPPTSAQVEIRRHEGADVLGLAEVYAQMILAGRSAAPAELRRGDLSPRDPYRSLRGSLRLIATAAVIAGLIVIGGLQWQITQHRRFLTACDAQQAACFQKLFPGKPLPAGVRSRLRGELDRLRSLNEGNGANEALSSLTTLHRLLMALPDSLRIRASEIRVEEGRLSLDVTAASHGDVAGLTEALTRQGFEVEPARAEQVSEREIAVSVAARLSPLPAERRP